jgi:hypothetical protein
MLFATDNEGRTFVHVATEFCELEVFQRIMNFAKGNVTKEEVHK